MGVIKEKLLQNFPTLRAQDLSNAWAYYEANKVEINTEIEENNAEYIFELIPTADTYLRVMNLLNKTPSVSKAKILSTLV